MRRKEAAFAEALPKDCRLHPMEHRLDTGCNILITSNYLGKMKSIDDDSSGRNPASLFVSYAPEKAADNEVLPKSNAPPSQTESRFLRLQVRISKSSNLPSLVIVLGGIVALAATQSAIGGICILQIRLSWIGTNLFTSLEVPCRSIVAGNGNAVVADDDVAEIFMEGEATPVLQLLLLIRQKLAEFYRIQPGRTYGTHALRSVIWDFCFWEQTTIEPPLENLLAGEHELDLEHNADVDDLLVIIVAAPLWPIAEDLPPFDHTSNRLPHCCGDTCWILVVCMFPDLLPMVVSERHKVTSGVFLHPLQQSVGDQHLDKADDGPLPLGTTSLELVADPCELQSICGESPKIPQQRLNVCVVDIVVDEVYDFSARYKRILLVNLVKIWLVCELVERGAQPRSLARPQDTRWLRRVASQCLRAFCAIGNPNLVAVEASAALVRCFLDGRCVLHA